MARKTKEQIRKEKQYKATTKYKSKTYKQVKFELHLVNDADIIELLEKQPNKAQFIRSKLRQ